MSLETIEIRPNRFLSVNVIDSNTADPTTIFMLHGLGGRAAQWSQLSKLLPSSFRYIIVDLLGHGENIKPKNAEYSYASFYLDIKSLFERYATKNNKIIAHSLGGAYATQLAHEIPNKIDQLILISPKPCRADKSVPSIFKLPPWLLEVLRPIFSKGFVKLAFTDKSDKQLIQNEVAAGKSNTMHMIRELVLSLKHIPNIDPTSIHIPTIVITGQEDDLVSRKEIDSYYQLFSNVEIIDIEEVGHLSLLEKPQLVADIINDNLK